MQRTVHSIAEPPLQQLLATVATVRHGVIERILPQLTRLYPADLLDALKEQLNDVRTQSEVVWERLETSKPYWVFLQAQYGSYKRIATILTKGRNTPNAVTQWHNRSGIPDNWRIKAQQLARQAGKRIIEVTPDSGLREEVGFIAKAEYMRMQVLLEQPRPPKYPLTPERCRLVAAVLGSTEGKTLLPDPIDCSLYSKLFSVATTTRVVEFCEFGDRLVQSTNLNAPIASAVTDGMDLLPLCQEWAAPLYVTVAIAL